MKPLLPAIDNSLTGTFISADETLKATNIVDAYLNNISENNEDHDYEFDLSTEEIRAHGASFAALDKLL
jgi:hypothetical protein